MPTNEEKLRNNFQLLSTEHLLERLKNGGLTESAEKIIEQVLSERNIAPESLARISKAIDAEIDSLNNLASIWLRFLARIIDTSIALIFLTLGAYFSSQEFVMPSTVGTALLIIYFLFADGLPKGKSIGKRLLRIAVIDERTKQPISYFQSLGRNITLPIIGLIDWVLILGKKRQRLGDLLAKTIVIKA